MSEEDARIEAERLRAEWFRRRAQEALQATAGRRPSGGALAQFGTGANEGIAAMAGLPVDAAAALINGMMPPRYESSIDPETGRPTIVAAEQTDAVTNPVGGAASIAGLLSPFMAAGEPETAAERYSRAIGREVGAGALPLGAAMRGVERPLSLLALEGASAAGSGVAEQVTEDLGGGELAQFLAAMAGGVAPIAMTGIVSRPQYDPREQVNIERNRAYNRVEDQNFPLTPRETDQLGQTVFDRAVGADMRESLHPQSNAVLGEFPSMVGDNATALDAERFRRLVQRNPGASVVPEERRIARQMIGGIDQSLGEMSAARGSDFFDDLVEARALNRRASNLQGLLGDTGAVTRATRRASTSGTGGNRINAIRQNIRAILDNPNRRRGFNAQELAMMEEIVSGSDFQNHLRNVAGFSPSRGFLPAAMNMGTTAGGLAAGGPVGAAIGASPAVAGLLADAVLQRSTNRSVDALIEALSGGVARPGVEVDDTAVRALITFLARQQANQE